MSLKLLEHGRDRGGGRITYKPEIATVHATGTTANGAPWIRLKEDDPEPFGTQGRSARPMYFLGENAIPPNDTQIRVWLEHEEKDDQVWHRVTSWEFPQPAEGSEPSPDSTESDDGDPWGVRGYTPTGIAASNKDSFTAYTGRINNLCEIARSWATLAAATGDKNDVAAAREWLGRSAIAAQEMYDLLRELVISGPDSREPKKVEDAPQHLPAGYNYEEEMAGFEPPELPPNPNFS